MTIENTTDVAQRVCGLLGKILNVDASALSPETTLEELGVDSLDIAELSSMLVEEGIKLDKADARQAASLADLVALARPR